jgi:spermidine synthase
MLLHRRTFALWLGLMLFAARSFADPATDTPAQAPSPPHIVFTGDSKWNHVIVADQGDLRSLAFGKLDDATQSTISLRNPKMVPMEYIRHAASALAFATRRRNLLVVGLGGGTFPMLVRRAFPKTRVEVVELDPLVRKVARDYFGVVEDASLRVHIADGAAFMKRAGRRWDLILLDAYGANSIPEPLATDEFFADVARRLAPQGLVIANVADADSSQRERDIIRRMAKHFPACVLQHTPKSDNVIVVLGATLPKDLDAALAALDAEARLPFPVAPMASRYRACDE